MEEKKKEFNQKFVAVVVKQVDTSNSIELPLWKDNHAHLSQDVWSWIEANFIPKSTLEEIKKEIEGKTRSKVDYPGGINADGYFYGNDDGYNQALSDVLQIINQKIGRE